MENGPLDLIWSVIPPSTIWYVSIPIFGLCLLGFMGYIFYLFREKILRLQVIRNFIQFPIEVRIFETREGGIFTECDWARLVKQNDDAGDPIDYYDLKLANTQIPVPELEHLMTGTKGRVVVQFFSPSRGIYYPITLDTQYALKGNDKVDLRANPILDEKIKALFRYLVDKKYRKFYRQSPLEQLLPIITIAVVAIGVTVIFIGVSGRLETIAKSFESMTPALQAIASNLVCNAALNKPPI